MGPRHPLVPSDRAPGLMLGPDVDLPDDVELGAHVVIHTGVHIGSGCAIDDGAVIGKQPRLSPRSRNRRGPAGDTVIEEGAAISAGAVVLAGTRIGAGTVVAVGAFVRERTTIGPHSLIGTNAVVGCDISVGARFKLQTASTLVSGSTAEDDVFVGPNATSMNDPSAGRAKGELRGVLLRRACRVGGGSALLPGIEVGEDAFVGSGAVVTRNVPAGAIAVGVPARVIGEVPAESRLPAD